ncbi:hypothetical protein HY412_00265 [Candidatus Kaiserbacteria bacterium]|nr:hypothetical protein [Candidatus Kaiserbacteria bacterium]
MHKIELQGVADDARRVFEKKSVEEALLVELYAAYADVGDTTLFVKRALSSFPRLACGVATVYLRHRLGTGEIIQGRYGKESHTFFLLDDTIVDITADQYGGPKTYVGKLRPPWSFNS